MKISEVLKLIDSDANVLTQKFFQECAYIRKDGEVLAYEDVEVKRIEARLITPLADKFPTKNERANVFYLHIN